MKFLNNLKARIGWLIAAHVLAFVFSIAITAQTTDSKSASDGAAAKPAPTLPKVKQIDNVSLKPLLKTNGKPLLINLWATWCVPCVEEFPELVKIDADYRGKIDFITISFDDLAEINRDVPKFLAEMKAEMPAYLLKTPDQDEAAKMISRNWQGGLPFTILFDAEGKEIFFRQGKIKPDILRAQIDKLVAPPSAEQNKQ